MTKLPALSAITTKADADLVYVVDVSNTTDDPTGSSFNITHASVVAQSDLWLFPLTVAALATLGATHSDGDIVSVKNFSTAEDEGGGLFRLDTSGALGASAEDGGVVIATDGPANSYWRRQVNGLRYSVRWWGAKGDTTGATGNGTDDSAKIQDASDYLDSLNATNIVRPTLLFPSSTGVGYRCVSTINIKENIHIEMNAAIIHDGTESSRGMLVGTAFVRNEGIKMTILMERAGISDWTDEGSTGIKIINAETCDIFAEVSILQRTGGFTVGLQCMGSGNGFVNSSVRLGHIGNNRIGVDLTSETVNGSHTGSSGAAVLTDSTQNFKVNSLVGETITNVTDGSTSTVTANTATTITGVLAGGTDNDWDNGDVFTVGGLGWCNNCEFYGGRFFAFTATHIGTERYGFRLTVVNSLLPNKSLNTNIFFHPSIECRIDCIPVLVVHGQKNIFIGCRDEANGPVFAKVLHDDDQNNHSNVFGIGRGTGTLVQQGNATGNVITHTNSEMSYSPARLVFDSGQMHQNAVWYDGTQVHIPNVHLADASSHGKVATTGFAFSVEEVFTTDFGTDNDKLLDTAHTRKNDDIVFLTTATALPGGSPGLVVGTLYYVVEKGTNDFKVSTAPGGSAVTFTDDGTGEHKYHGRDRYLTITSGSRALGIEVETDQAKNFVFTRDTEVGFEGRLVIRAYDADGFHLQNQEEFTVDDVAGDAGRFRNIHNGFR